MSLFTRAVVAVTHNPVTRRLITGTPPGRALASRFVAGDDLDAAIRVARNLADRGLSVSLDLLGEEVRDRPMAEAALAAYQASLDRIQQEGLPANISVKLTQLGLVFDPGFTRDALDVLAERAGERGTTVTIDMEDSRYTQATVDLYASTQARHGNLGVCLQAYLKRTPQDLERLLPLGGHIRLCKGAYLEPPELAFQGRAEVRAAFLRLLEVLMRDERVRPAIATHDDVLIRRTLELAKERTGPFEFQMLYGVREPLQGRLAAAGHDLRIYLPFGSEWYPYLTRRLAERPANLVFFVRALLPGGDSRGIVPRP
ncbi:MAG: proline dehydrogenase [Acidimicrobiia bacterium]|nr:MAG: proline dehydrogenase [Acidimicrobiia bacterium]